MDALRGVQFLTDLAYLWLGIGAIGAALLSRERARFDVAILFGALAGSVALQEIRLLSCFGSTGCLDVPWSTQLTTVLVLILPYALLRLVDDVSDVPSWQMNGALGLLVVLVLAFAFSGAQPPGWLVLVLTIYLIVGTAFAAWAFASRAKSTIGITRRRMAAIAWACALLAATIVLAVAAPGSRGNELVLTGLSRVTGLVSGLCFWAGFFPPHWLSQAWRQPELLGYLRPTRLMAAPNGQQGAASDAMAIDRLCAATASTTGARRVFLILEDTHRHDLYLWGAPSARIQRSDGLIGRVLQTAQPLVVRDFQAGQLPPALGSVFGSETPPRTAMLVPIGLDGGNVGVLAAFAEKGPMFVQDDLEVVSFFAAEAAAILRMQRYRQSVTELEALREADRLKDEFMAVVSHELRTPLTAISGYSDILLRKLSGPLNDRQERQVVGVRDAARRLLSLINDLLDVSKLEAGTLDLHLAPLDPQTVIVRASAAVRVIAASKGVSIQVRDSADRLAPVRADDERLQQILTNLLMNSIKFTPQGGSIWISARAETAANGPEVVFTVEDTGVGLAPGQAERVWERFYQVESSSTRRFGGVGLGLSIVRRLVELHGGRVEAMSAGLGRGSTFSVYLPAATADETPEAYSPGVPPRPQFAPATIMQPQFDDRGAPLVLVVEDDLHSATVLRTYLEADGYAVQVAQDGSAALQFARSLRPFTITLDISLPKLDGWSVLSALKRDSTTAAIPVVIVSMVDNRDFGMVLGATEYLVKPIEHERLRTVLRGLNRMRGAAGDHSVLVVDDDPALRDMLGNLLVEDGWRVTTAGDGEAALAAIAREKPTAMVLDLMMPRIDGFEVLQTLHGAAATRDLPVIVVTAKNLGEDDRDRLARCAHRVIVKHALAVNDLRQEMRQLLVAHKARENTTADNRQRN